MLGSSHSTLGICTLLGATWRGQDALPPQQAKPGLAGGPGSRQPARRRRYGGFSVPCEDVPSLKTIEDLFHKLAGESPRWVVGSPRRYKDRFEIRAHIT